MTHFLPTDHLRHQPDASGRMRDSLFWQSTIAEEKLGFQAYLYLTAKGIAGFNVAIWGEDGQKRVVDFVQGEISADMNLDNFALAGLQLKKTGFGERAHVTYSGDKVKLEFEFEGRHPPFSYHANPDGLPSWFALNRYEQTGTLRGFIDFGGRRITLDRMGHRDHSWGNRIWGMPQHWKWFVAYTPDGSRMINGWFWIARGEWGCAGYVARDGMVTAIRTIRQKAQYDADMSQRRLEADIIDVDGGETRLVMDRFGVVKLPGNDKVGTIIMEAACTATIDGAPASGQFETQWQQAYIDHLIETKSVA